MLERPASSTESQAKPKGPLPSGAGAFARSPATGVSSTSAKPQTSGAETSGSQSGDAPAAGAKSAGLGAQGAGSGSKGARPGTVKVIVGTRRYHSTDCPLIKGAGESGVETMTLAAAEAAGLTSCSVCQHDRETVA
ncbi:hypothetical protein ETD86_48695 [Nonomuraea turkmeniaca]|uniref:Uncharacterized protein n=1 Tax=Nonomuraea turkmeniaca TaxID=103838 RepID=A0A5S4EX76_9ACTN|nr:hypothetical protein ETD86_48695 [Nonomuraea turkmeniaca]